MHAPPRWYSGHMLCPGCQFDNPANMRFCGQCGTALEHLCAKCKAVVPTGFKFCGECGHSQAPARAPETQRRHLTVLFSDLVNSTQLSERLDPEEYLEIIRAYQTQIASAIDAWQGHLAQYLGDGVLAYFGYPRAQEDDAVRAVRCALKCVAAIDALSQQLELRHGVRVRARIGIHTGVVVAGSIGSGDRTDQLALGSTPNIAARVQGLAAPSQVVMTRATWETVQRAIRARSIGEHTLGGVQQPVELFVAEGTRNAEDASDESTFVGRTHEMGELQDTFNRAIGQHGQWLLVYGEPGIGKSRLLSEFKRRVAGSAQWLSARCSSYHENVDHYALSDMLRRRIGLAEGADATAQRNELTDWLRDQGWDPDTLSSAVDGFATALGIATTAGDEAQRDRAHATVLDWMVEISTRTPLVFCVEDAHWVDPSTLDFLNRAMDTLANGRILVIVSARQQFQPGWPTGTNRRVLYLGRIAADDSAILVRSSVDAELPDGVVQQLVERADGVPLYLEELVASARRHAQGDFDFSHFVPQSLQDSLMARIDALGPAREIAQIGALLGRSFSVAMLQAVSKETQDAISDRVQRVVDSGLLQKVGAGSAATLRFRHSLMQDTAYQSLLLSDRRTLHARVAQAMQERFPDLAKQEPQTLARHCEGAEQISDAIRHFVAAGERANDRAAVVESVRFFRHAQQLLPRVAEENERNDLERIVLQGMVRPISSRGGYADGELRPIIDRLKALRPDRTAASGHFRTLSTEWGYHSMRGHREETWHYANACLELALESGRPRQLIFAYYATGSTHFYSGNFLAAERDLSRSLELAAEDHPFGESRRDFDDATFLARIVLGWCLSLRGYPDRATTLLDETLELARHHGAVFAHVQALFWALYVDWDMRRPNNRLLGRFDEIIQQASEHGIAYWLRNAINMRQWIRYGDGDDGAYNPQAITLLASSAIEGVVGGYAVVRLVDTLIQRGNLADARIALDNAQRRVETSLGVLHAPEALRQQGILAALDGDTDVALTRFRQAVELATACGSRTQALTALVDMHRHVHGVPTDELRALFDAYTEGRNEPLLQQAAALLAGH
ncbi:MAG: adenylate/guanylate cyclase domain-containing protein [Pseudomonadales bacterium]